VGKRPPRQATGMAPPSRRPSSSCAGASPSTRGGGKVTWPHPMHCRARGGGGRRRDAAGTKVGVGPPTPARQSGRVDINDEAERQLDTGARCGGPRSVAVGVQATATAYATIGFGCDELALATDAPSLLLIAYREDGDPSLHGADFVAIRPGWCLAVAREQGCGSIIITR